MLTNLSHKTIITATQIARVAMIKARTMAENLNVNAPSFQELKVWLNIATNHFDLMTCLCVYQINGLIRSKVLDSSTKSITVVYYDDKMVGERILQLGEQMKQMAGSFSQYDQFNFKDSCMYSSSVVNTGISEVIKK